MVQSTPLVAADTTDGARRRRPRRWAGALAVVVAAVLAGAVPSPVQAAGGASQFVADANSARSAHGAKALSTSSDLASVAQHWAQQMADSGELSHNPKLTSEVGHWQKLGENVGYGPDVETIQDAFMHSSGHRANILDGAFTQIGVGVVVKNGVVWVSEVFRQSDGTAAAAAHHAKAQPKKHPAPPAAKKMVVKPAKIVEVDHQSPQTTATTSSKAVASKAPSLTAKPAVSHPAAPQPSVQPSATPSAIAVLLVQGGSGPNNPGPVQPSDPNGGGGSGAPAAVAIAILAVLLGISLRVRPPV